MKSKHTTILRVLLKPPATDQPTHRPLSTDPLTTDRWVIDRPSSTYVKIEG